MTRERATRRWFHRSTAAPAPDPEPGPETGVATSEDGGATPPEAPTGVRATIRAVRVALRPIGRRRLVKAILAITGIGVFGLVVFGGFGMWWTSQPSFCGRCHVMEKYVDAWDVSTHKDVNCESCHVPTGAFGFLGGKITSLQVVLNFALGHYEDTSFNASVPNSNCLKCHGDVLEGDVETDKIRVRHSEIIGAGAKCMLCHSAVAHGSAVPVGSHTVPEMDTCFKCHDNQVAPLKCNLCHVTPPIATEPESHGSTSTTEPRSD